MHNVHFNRSVDDMEMTEKTELWFKKENKYFSGNSACGLYSQPFTNPMVGSLCSKA